MVDIVSICPPPCVELIRYVFLLLFLIQGTAGFGIGKGANEAVAVKKALRAARRDLIFVDRYKVDI